MTEDQQRTFRNFVSGLIRENRRQRGYSDSDEEWVKWQSKHESEIRMIAKILIGLAPFLNASRAVQTAADIGSPLAADLPFKGLFETQEEEIDRFWREFGENYRGQNRELKK